MPKLNLDALTKGEIRKLNALKKSVGDELGEEVFIKWLVSQPKAPKVKPDPVAERIVNTLESAGLANANLGLYGYTVRKARGIGASGLVAIKNQNPDS